MWKPEGPADLDIQVDVTPDAHPDTRRVVRAAIIHYTAGRFDGAVEWLSAPDDTQVSAHYVLARDGRIAQLCRVGRVAYHAGMRWGREYNPNTWSIGYELESLPGDTVPEYTDAQYRHLAALISWYCAEHGLIPTIADAMHTRGKGKLWWRGRLDRGEGQLLLLGHSEVNPGKPDPGAGFDWQRLMFFLQNKKTPHKTGAKQRFSGGKK